MTDRLNLGSGEFPKSGYVNVDYHSQSAPDVRHDLDDFPYPFESGRFSVIEADHVLEHLRHPFRFMEELARVGKAGCTIRIRVPHFSRGFTHADHKRSFDVSFPLYFTPGFVGYTGTRLVLVSMRLRWFAQPYLKRQVLSKSQYLIGRTLGAIFDFCARISPYACSRLWCFWVGGFDEIEFMFRIPDDDGSRASAKP